MLGPELPPHLQQQQQQQSTTTTTTLTAAKKRDRNINADAAASSTATSNKNPRIDSVTASSDRWTDSHGQHLVEKFQRAGWRYNTSDRRWYRAEDAEFDSDDDQDPNEILQLQ
eukprot:GEZU01042520.1.p1 GENE.GEZU01042520.1~~GEZU01042520.1.p1  ORF type:complete len:113 (-),score=25.11 GEZU01042520.1:8-346(-)